ncbi:IstB-like ATP binding protein [Loktanella atrilutea]|uniref:IstB-like ATP binding protein n=1 Tax=Loktanella atrilutea TaxID=366533 RepID=A0A1M5G2W5_LOKAT|nr:IstB-like ATP binding protein [Loktanella atrilutea]
MITFDRNRYSVPASFANRPVSLHIYPEQLVIVAEGHLVCEHQRIIERSHRQAGQLAESLVRFDLVILDELGYLPFSASCGALLFYLLSKLYERTSIVITTYLSFSEWSMSLGTPK